MSVHCRVDRMDKVSVLNEQCDSIGTRIGSILPDTQIGDINIVILYNN